MADSPASHSTPGHDLQGILEAALKAAVVAALGADYADADPMVRAAQDPKHGDFQANLAMGLAKRVGDKPRAIAERIVAALAALPEADALLAEPPQVAGPGFINLRLSAAALDAAAASIREVSRTGPNQPQRVVVDYASPNLAKEMHVGHLRSTIIGDALVRVLEAMGDTVVKQNHIGDWGTQFGMLLEHLIETGWSPDGDHAIADLNTLYQEAKKRDDAEPAFAEAARKRVVALQAGEAEARAIWSSLIDESVRHMNDAFARLGVLLTDDDLKAESFYNDKLGPVCDELESLGVAKMSDGALCVFVEGEEAPLIVRKSDGGYGYATTDLAAVKYRVQELDADRVIYVVDSRQRDHFGKFFAAARSAGWVGDDVTLDYASFGTILGPDRKPFKTREGGTVKLADVLDEAVARAGDAVARKNPDLSDEERANVATVVGIGAVKYADLSNDRIKDYVFDWDRMLALEGNTSPYLQYSYTRIQSIFRKGGVSPEEVSGYAVAVQEPAERELVLKLSQFSATVASVGASLEPHRLCTYLFELATRYHRFYEACPVLKADDDATKQSRLALCGLVAATIEAGLGLLGIGVVERM
ncbi:MAG: arginine--tRNA ligase [Planctomycetota bacterium]